MFCQPVCGLIDAYHQRVRMRFRNERRAHASAAERIEDQGSLLALKPVEQLRERSPRMRGAGFAPWVPLVVLDNLFEVWVRSQLVRCECRRSEVRLICLRRDSHLAIIPRRERVERRQYFYERRSPSILGEAGLPAVSRCLDPLVHSATLRSFGSACDYYVALAHRYFRT